jgi:hypothetical protein
VQRASQASLSGCEHVTLALHKPQSSSGLGIRLEERPVRARDGNGNVRAVVVGALLPGALSQSSRALRAGDRVAITP